MKIVLLNVEQAQNIYRSQMVRDFPESELKPFASVQGMMTRGLYAVSYTHLLGCCSALAVTTTVSGALGMGLAMTFVLVCSNIVISALRKVIPAKVHLPCYIVIIATFVTIVQMVLQAYVPALYKACLLYTSRCV